MVIKITYDWKEYQRLSGSLLDHPLWSCNGYRLNGVIWLKKQDTISLLHELGHGLFGDRVYHSGSSRLFFDFLDSVYDTVYHILRHKSWRRKWVTALKWVWIDFNDWLDWILCRN